MISEELLALVFANTVLRPPFRVWLAQEVAGPLVMHVASCCHLFPGVAGLWANEVFRSNSGYGLQNRDREPIATKQMSCILLTLKATSRAVLLPRPVAIRCSGGCGCPGVSGPVGVVVDVLSRHLATTALRA